MKMKRSAFSMVRKSNGKAGTESTGIVTTEEVRMTKTQIKIMLVTFDVMGIVHYSFIPHG
jgi:hypothetical protein